MSSTEHAKLNRQDRETILKTATAAIRHGLRHGQLLSIDPTAHTERLRAIQSCFVTLLKHGQLRGCIGSLSPTRTLIEDVAANAYSAAFKDPRFPAVTAQESSSLVVHVSVLSPHSKIEFSSHADLIRQLRPGVDGVIVEHREAKATFLPSVWDTLSDPEQFLQQLRRKATISDKVTTTELTVWCYRVENVDGDVLLLNS